MELDALSQRVDGRVSIEHQLSIHVNDLLDLLSSQYATAANDLVRGATAVDDEGNADGSGITTGMAVGGSGSSSEESIGVVVGTGTGVEKAPVPPKQVAPTAAPPEITLQDILAGLRYVMDYRIRGGRHPSLELDMMRKLVRCLLMLAKWNGGGHAATTLGRRGVGRLLALRHGKTSREADVAFELFGEFLEEVSEFRIATAEIPAYDLRQSLAIHRRLRANPDARDIPLAMLCTITRYLPNEYPDWRELVNADQHAHVEELMRDYLERHPEPEHKKVVVPAKEQLFPPPALYFDRRVRRVVDMFQTDVEQGLRASQIEERRSFYGRNDLPAPPRPNVFGMLWTQITDFMVIILILASVLAGSLGDIKSCIVLLVVVLFNVIVGFVQEFKANRALEALLTLHATVLRDGQSSSVPSGDLVPGDIVILEEGEAVPADLRLVEVAQLEVIESILTGESVGVTKKTDPIQTRTRRLPLGDCLGNAFMSTVVARGRGKGVVVRTGHKTEIGKISKAISSTKDILTPMQIRLKRLGIILVIVSVLLCALVVIVGLAWGRRADEILLLGVTLAVSVIPEGLVAVVTITMAIGVRRMAARDAIVRKLSSVETLGSVTVICSDKTGTLTEGKMTAEEVWTTNERSYRLTNESAKAKGDPSAGSVTLAVKVVAITPTVAGATPSSPTASSATVLPKDIDQLPLHLVASSMVCALCNNSNIALDDDGKTWKFVGDPTEIALLVAANKAGLSRDYWAAQHGTKKLGEFAFDSDRKLMSALYDMSAVTNSRLRVPVIGLAKGAPEALLARCTSYLAADATDFATGARPLSDAHMETIAAQSTRMASSGLRVLGLAMRILPSVDEAQRIIASADSSLSETELTFIGLIGMIDPPRVGVKESVATCKKAGINVIMITGDHIITALAIATSLGILEPQNPQANRAMKGVELDLLSEDALNALRPFPNVFARVSPDNKLRIVKALQAQGHFVAMTGDGVNDAPSIKAANVGVAMGIGGTEITKQAADIVLANDNFSTIEAAVEEGRHVFDNILKFILYLLSCNFAEIFVMLVSISVGLKEPFTPIMILFANIIADVPPSMAMGVEPADPNIMNRRPRNPKQGILTRESVFVITYQALTMGIIAFVAYVWMLIHDGAFETGADVDRDARAQTLAFVGLTFCQLFQAFLSRSTEMSVFRTGFFGNRYMVGGVTFSVSVLMLAVYVPAIANLFEMVALVSWVDWLTMFVMIVVQLAFNELMKFGLRRRRRRQEARLPVAVAVPHAAPVENSVVTSK